MTVHDMRLEHTIEISASAQALYDMVADVARMGEWSPENIGGTWVDGALGRVGDRFDGRNRIGDYEWTVTCEVTAAEPGEVFEWVAGAGVDGGPFVRWTYRFAGAEDGSTVVTETYDVEVLPPALASRTPDQLEQRKAQVSVAMQATLAALKEAAEAS